MSGGTTAISVVMPVWNAALTLGCAVDSIRAQTAKDWELIVVDDGSTDGSTEALTGYAAGDERVRVIATPHRGVACALNEGIALARGRFVARMDADDLARPERLERQAAHLEQRPEVGLVASRVVFDGDRERRAGYARYVDWTNTLLSHDDIALAAFVESPVAHPSVMFRREVIDRFGGYADGDFPEDYELWLRWLAAGVRMEKLAEPLLVWRDSAGRLSRRDPRYSSEAFYRVKTGYLACWLATRNAHHPRVTVWGAGRVTRQRARHLTTHGVEIEAFVDIDLRKIGRRIGGVPVIGPEQLPPPGRCFVVSYVASTGARDLIAARLTALGYKPGVDYLLAA